MDELSPTMISDSQSSARGARQRDDQRDEREQRVRGVPKAMTSVFQV